jgi:hypothetical protein
LFGFFFDPEDGGNMFPKTSADFQRATRQKIELLITTTVRTSNPTLKHRTTAGTETITPDMLEYIFVSIIALCKSCICETPLKKK